jgi:TRAP-type C4-dicarboxylate transport system permease small subunit
MTEFEAPAARKDPGGIVGAYIKFMTVLAGLSMGTVLTIMITQVIARYVFNASLIWAEELCRYILVWQTFLFVGIAYHYGELAILDIISPMVTPRTRLAIRTIVTIPVVYFLFLLIQTGLVHASRFKAQNIPAIDFIWTSLTGAPANLPVFWIYVSVPIGCAILLAHFVISLLDDARTVLRPASPSSSNQAAG